jgi:hypothetical protein
MFLNSIARISYLRGRRDERSRSNSIPLSVLRNAGSYTGIPTMPPGPQLYSLLSVPTTDYPVLGVPATTLVIAVFNGGVYGIIALLAYTVLNKTGIIK